MKNIERKLSKWRLSGKIRHHIYKRSTHLPSVWYVHSTFAYKNALGPLKIYSGKVCAETFVDYIECKSMTELTDTFKREYEAAEKYLSVLKTLRIEREVNTVITWVYI